MKRRGALKQIGFIIGGSLWLPTYLGANYRRDDSILTQPQEEALSDVVDWLIPETDIPGAKELGVHLFVMKMVAECHDKETQTTLANDLTELLNYVSKESGNSWGKSSKEHKEAAFQQVFSSERKYSKSSSFPVIKRRTIQGFLSSEYIMTNVFVYEMAPGRYDGYFPV